MFNSIINKLFEGAVLSPGNIGSYRVPPQILFSNSLSDWKFSLCQFHMCSIQFQRQNSTNPLCFDKRFRIHCVFPDRDFVVSIFAVFPVQWGALSLLKLIIYKKNGNNIDPEHSETNLRVSPTS